MHVTFRPLASWPHEDHGGNRRGNPFKAAWSDTLYQIGYEVERLEGEHIILGAGFREQDIRIDGMPRSGARNPEHPGVEISFDSMHGRLVYATDVFSYWEANVRAIALGLEALRKVDRYGISQGQQYAGFRALPSGDDPNPTRGRSLVHDTYGGNMRAALQHTHPDGGGTARDFADVQAYREQQEEVAA